MRRLATVRSRRVRAAIVAVVGVLVTTGVTARYFHTCGIRTDHTLWCWGDNPYGQLGLGDTRDRDHPVRVR